MRLKYGMFVGLYSFFAIIIYFKLKNLYDNNIYVTSLVLVFTQIT